MKKYESYLNKIICRICKKVRKKYINDKKCCYRGTVHSIRNLEYSIPKEISVVFQNGLNYGYHFP